MKKGYANDICAQFHLGTLLHLPIRIHGGLLHSMWRFDTDKGTYAVKQLSKDIDLTDERIIKNYELSEHIALRFALQGIPAIYAMEKSGKYLFMIDDTGFLVYPWVDAKALTPHTVSEVHALKIAAILAKMHLINLAEPRITKPEFYTHTKKKIIATINKAERFGCSFAGDLRKNQGIILEANEAYHRAISSLAAYSVVSHGDLDQKNVLWDKQNNPILIDWESARKLNPTYEIVNTALDWSGIALKFDKRLFSQIIVSYMKAGGTIDEDTLKAAFYGVLGNWINWLVYNIERSCTSNESAQRTLSIEQVNQTLAIILLLQIVKPEVIKIIEEI